MKGLKCMRVLEEYDENVEGILCRVFHSVRGICGFRGLGSHLCDKKQQRPDP